MTGIEKLDRRALLLRALALVGATLLPGGVPTLADAAKAGKRTLDNVRFALLTAVADTIVPQTDTPGAVSAGVPKKLDALLRDWASPARRADLIAALDAIDALSRQQHARSFAALEPNEQRNLLVAHDSAALQPVSRRQEVTANPTEASKAVADPNDRRVEQAPVQSNPLIAEPEVADPAYAKLKELIVILFYYSETALTHELRYVHAPGQWRPSVPVTAETRAPGGISVI